MADTNANQKGGEEGDEDYMGDLSKFLPTDPSSQPSKPKKLPPKTLTISSEQQSSKKKPKFHNWQDHRKLEKERKQRQEDERTLENIQQSTIPQSNIGFKLLKQMGYTPGKGLGKDSTGRDEPIGVEIRRSRAGIGREDPAKERARKEKEKVELKMKTEKVMMEDFEVRKKLEWKSKRVVVNYHKAKAVVDQLENRQPEVEVEEGDGDGDGDEEEEEEEEEVITEEDLEELLVRLREEHFYCLFCGCQYESKEALLSNCPGLNEDDH